MTRITTRRGDAQRALQLGSGRPCSATSSCSSGFSWSMFALDRQLALGRARRRAAARLGHARLPREVREAYRDIRGKLARINAYPARAITGDARDPALQPGGSRVRPLREAEPRAPGRVTSARSCYYALFFPMVELLARGRARADLLVRRRAGDPEGAVIARRASSRSSSTSRKLLPPRSTTSRRSTTSSRPRWPRASGSSRSSTRPPASPTDRRGALRATARRDRRSTTSGSRTRTRLGAARRELLGARPARRSRSSATPARARRRSSRCSLRLLRAAARARAPRRHRRAHVTAARAAPADRPRTTGRVPLQPDRSRTTSGSGAPLGDGMRSRRRGGDRNAHGFLSALPQGYEHRAPRARGRAFGGRAAAPGVRARASPPIRRSSSSTRRHRASTAAPRGSIQVALDAAPRRAAPRS